jgi:ketosteroid isomerase-like protein
MKSCRFVTACFCAMLVISASAARAQQSSLSDTILALERGAMDRWLKGDPSGYLDLLADDATIFDPRLDARMDGRAAAVAFFEPQVRGKVSIPKFEILNPRVVPLGPAAVLTYNLNTYDANGAVTSRWNFSEVYRLSKGRWEIVQSHASFVHGQPVATAR